MRQVLAVSCNRGNYEYDIHALVQSFYPTMQVKVLLPEKWEEQGVSADVVVSISDGRAQMVFRMRDGEAFASGGGQTDGCSDTLLKSTKEQADHSHEYIMSLPAEKEKAKAAFKHFLYETLCAETKATLPWGNLTGIRPTKLAMEWIERGASGQDVILFLQKEHYVSPEKAALCLDIAMREKSILEQLDRENGYSLYIGIPFCPT
ncbi:MAG: hypothetical protein K2I07_03755, partial [Lachnospiraceae bacterium]|nr:hypothetical protein [Lachnospiraceae bacterium]